MSCPAEGSLRPSCSTTQKPRIRELQADERAGYQRSRSTFRVYFISLEGHQQSAGLLGEMWLHIGVCEHSSREYDSKPRGVVNGGLGSTALSLSAALNTRLADRTGPRLRWYVKLRADGVLEIPQPSGTQFLMIRGSDFCACKTASESRLRSSSMYCSWITESQIYICSVCACAARIARGFL